MLTTAAEQTDWHTLVDQAKQGCDQSLGQILEEVRDYLLLIAESELGNRVRSKFGASDIVQHSMLEAQHAFNEFRGTSENEFRYWLKRIVINNLTDQARRYTHTHSRNVRLEISADDSLAFQQHAHLETPSWHMSRDEVDQQLATAVSLLPDRQRFVIEARHRHQLNYSQIAAQLQISEAGVRKIWSRATEQLRAHLEHLA